MRRAIEFYDDNIMYIAVFVMTCVIYIKRHLFGYGELLFLVGTLLIYLFVMFFVSQGIRDVEIMKEALGYVIKIILCSAATLLICLYI